MAGADDVDKPALWRLRDHALGGPHSFTAERIHWQMLTDAYPPITTVVRETASFRVRAVEHLAGIGVLAPGR